MQIARNRLTAAIAGATLCLFASAAYGQNTQTTTGTTTADPAVTNQTGTAPTTLGTQPTTTPTATDNAAQTTPVIDNTATTDTVDNDGRGFPWGILGLLGLAGLLKRPETVRRETYTTTTGPRTVSTADDRMNLTPRAASGTGTGTSGTGTGTGSSTTSGGMGDPNARR